MAQTDRDLASIAEARSLARRAKAAAPVLAEFSQEQIDAIVDAMAAAIIPQAEALARLAHEETGYGVVADKIQKNLFASEQVYKFIRPMKTVGVIRRLEDRKVVEIADPFGVVCAIVPTTNPTSTAIYKILISLKARCPIVISPHPSAVRCISRCAEIMNEAARRAGAPEGAISCMTTVTLEGTQELMKAREVAVILATGGMGLVRAAYSAGKPAYGVGPGNAPAFIERTADVPKAVRDVVTGKTFDNGVLCSSENSVVVDGPVVEEAKREFVKNGTYFLSDDEADNVARVLLSPQRLPNPALVGRPATFIAQQAGISVPPGTRVLIAELKGVGRDYPLSIEKLCPVLSFYVVADWHLINIKRLAYEVRPVVVRQPPASERAGTPMVSPGAALPRPPAQPVPPGGIAADVLAHKIDEFLTSRGYRPAGATPSASAPSAPAPSALPAPSSELPTDFVCEDDVRQAIKQNRKIVIGEKTIVTPSARDLGEEHRLFVQAGWAR